MVDAMKKCRNPCFNGPTTRTLLGKQNALHRELASRNPCFNGPTTRTDTRPKAGGHNQVWSQSLF